MLANLIYKNDKNIILQSSQLIDIDKFTLNFKNELELRKHFNLPTEINNGELIISFKPNTLPLQEMYYFNFNDGDLAEEKYLKPLYKNDNCSALQKDFVRDIKIYLNELEYREFLETMFAGFIDTTLEEFLLNRSKGEEGYFFMRYIRDCCKNFKLAKKLK